MNTVIMLVLISFGIYIIHRRRGSIRKNRGSVGGKGDYVDIRLRDARERSKEGRWFHGVTARFGCGHTQKIQLMDELDCIVRNVVHWDAPNRNCHRCYLKTGIDRLADHKKDDEGVCRREVAMQDNVIELFPKSGKNIN